ncbi:MAG: hypothetical protein J7L77_03520 [Clostridiales bacterium]|nr:hypothetical protein [Clostridiales bacterium]
MLSEDFLTREQQNLKALGDKLHKDALFTQQFIDSGKRPENEMQWFGSVRSDCIYGTFLLKNLLDSLDDYKDKSEEQISFYIGKIAIQSFLEIINSFEQSTIKLLEENDYFSNMLRDRLEPNLLLIEESWKEDVPGKSKKLKKDLIRLYKRRMKEMGFIRDTLHKEEIIDDLDKQILEFTWDIRNSMHSNFVAIKDIKFSPPGTSLNYTFDFKKGQELYHPHDLLSFYSMTEQLIFIQLKILQKFNEQSEG